MDNWYQMPVSEVIDRLETSIDRGLSRAEVDARQEKYGPNELVERGRKSPLSILLSQFTETMVVILMIAAVISLLVGEPTDAIAVLAIVVINALLGFRQEYQAEQAMAALKKLAVPTVRVRRDGHVVEISARDLVPGDVVLLEAGNLIPADGRLVESANLRIQEAALTGESEPVAKEIDPINKDNLSLGDRHNVVYMGTVVTFGRGQAVVTEIGMNTQLGNIADMLQAGGYEPTPLQKRLDQLGKGLAVAAFGLVMIVFLIGLIQGESIRTLILTSISMAVAAVPEGLPAVVTIALSLGAQRMLKRRALIRKLPAVEALGSVTVICSDKTGTLTENRMTVTILDVAQHRIDLTDDEARSFARRTAEPCIEGTPTEEQQRILKENPALVLLLAGGALANDAVLECEEGRPDSFHIVGDPTEGALVVASARVGLDKDALDRTFPRVGEAPFESDRKRMTTVHAMPEAASQVPPAFQPIWDWGGEMGAGRLRYFAFTKGAMDSLLNVSDRVWNVDHTEPLNAEWRQRIEDANRQLAENGMRVLGVAVQMLDELPGRIDESIEQNLVFVGLSGMIDPARAEVRDAVQTCRTAGIRPMMITGDHPLTARYIARELGIASNGRVITGQELERMSQQELEETVMETSVFARVSPEHKLKIVDALQNRGQLAAMTGDGVNDAPALKQANIGVAMGITGTDVSKEAADIVLLDDNFATIVAAVEEGRVIYDNIRKFIRYTLTSNTGEIWIMLLAPFLGMPLALLPLQILWINLVTDGVPGLALSVEKAEPNTMRRPPYPPNENVFARGLARDILIYGFLMGIIALAAGYVYWLNGSPYWQTIIFSTITLSEMGYVLAIRSNRYSFFQMGPFSNPALIGAVILTIFLQLAVIYVPFLQEIFETQSLPLNDLLIVFLLATSLFWIGEFHKWLLRRSSGV